MTTPNTCPECLVRPKAEGRARCFSCVCDAIEAIKPPTDADELDRERGADEREDV